MSVYILDSQYEPRKSGRKWEEMLPTPIPVEFNDLDLPTGVVERASHRAVRASQGVRHLIVVHLSSITSSPERVTAIKGTGIPLLVVSRESYHVQEPGLPESEGSCYYRKAGVLERGEGVDTAFGECFLKFWNKYQEPEGELDWALLEPKPWPRHLVALYLVAKSLELSGGTERTAILEEWRKLGSRNQIWQKAVEEYRGRGGATSKWPGTGQQAPDPSRDFDVGTAVAEIHQVLAPR